MDTGPEAGLGWYAVKLHVASNICDLHGQCVFVAPSLFRFSETGQLEYVEEVPAGQEHAARAAAVACPTRAIEIDD
jgi:ferredoxin